MPRRETASGRDRSGARGRGGNGSEETDDARRLGGAGPRAGLRDPGVLPKAPIGVEALTAAPISLRRRTSSSGHASVTRYVRQAAASSPSHVLATASSILGAAGSRPGGPPRTCVSRPGVRPDEPPPSACRQTAVTIRRDRGDSRGRRGRRVRTWPPPVPRETTGRNVRWENGQAGVYRREGQEPDALPGPTAGDHREQAASGGGCARRSDVFAPSPIYTVTIEAAAGGEAEYALPRRRPGLLDRPRWSTALGARCPLRSRSAAETGVVLRTLIEREGVALEAVPLPGWNGGYVPRPREAASGGAWPRCRARGRTRHEVDDLYDATPGRRPRGRRVPS